MARSKAGKMIDQQSARWEKASNYGPPGGVSFPRKAAAVVPDNPFPETMATPDIGSRTMPMAQTGGEHMSTEQFSSMHPGGFSRPVVTTPRPMTSYGEARTMSPGGFSSSNYATRGVSFTQLHASPPPGINDATVSPASSAHNRTVSAAYEDADSSFYDSQAGQPKVRGNPQPLDASKPSKLNAVAGAMGRAVGRMRGNTPGNVRSRRIVRPMPSRHAGKLQGHLINATGAKG